MKLTIDPEFRDLIPPLATEELTRLHESLNLNGCQSPLIVWKEEQTLVDGHNRYAYLAPLEIPFGIVEMSFDDREEVKRFIILNQLGRRNVPPDVASYLRGLLYNGTKKEQGGDHKSEKSKDQNDTLISTAETVAKQTGVSAPTVKRDAKFADALAKLKMTIGDFEKSGKSKKDIIAGAFPPKPSAPKASAAPIDEDPPALVVDGTKPESLTHDEAKRLEFCETELEKGVSSMIATGTAVPFIMALLPRLSKDDLSKVMGAAVARWEAITGISTGGTANDPGR